LLQYIATLIGASNFAPTPSPSPSSRRAVVVPPEWVCDPSFYGAHDGCDCDCGIQDPDCSDELIWPPLRKPGQRIYAVPVFDCYDDSSPFCQNGLCVYGPTPSGWTCDPSYYNATDGCDCNCGVFDPDCLLFLGAKYIDIDPDQFTVFGCTQGNVPYCQPDATCGYARPVSTDWFCPIEWFGSGDGCDCNCGFLDPDCSDPTQSVLSCPCDGMTCRNDQGLCVGSCGDLIVSIRAAGPTPTPVPSASYCVPRPQPSPTPCPPANCKPCENGKYGNNKDDDDSTEINFYFADMLGH